MPVKEFQNWYLVLTGIIVEATQTQSASTLMHVGPITPHPDSDIDRLGNPKKGGDETDLSWRYFIPYNFQG